MAEPAFRSGPPERLTSWTDKSPNWGSQVEVTTLQGHVSDVISKGYQLSTVVQVMLARLVLPCQSRDSSLWEFDPAGDRPLKHLFGFTHKEIWKHLFKSQKEWPKETEDAGYSTAFSALEVMKNSAKHISPSLFNDNRNWSFCVIDRAVPRRRPGSSVRRLCTKTRNRLD